MEKNEIDPYRDYFEMMSSEREANMNRQGYKRMKHDYYIKNGYNPELLDLDYAYDAGNKQNTDILPAVSKKEDDSVTEDILLDTNTRDGMAWAAASKALYDAYDIKEKRERLLKKLPTAGQSYRTRFYEKLKNKKEPETPQEFGQWGIEHIGWLNYNLPSFGVSASKLPHIVKTKPKSAYAFLHLLNTYEKLPMFTWNGTKRFFNGVLNDPSTYFGLGTLGISLAGKKFATSAGKGGLKKALNAAIDPAAMTMYEGALYAAADDFFRQKVAIEAGPEVEGGQESYSPSKGAFAAGTGLLATGALVGVAKVAPYAYDAVKGVINKGAESAKARIAERGSGTTLYSNPIGPIADEVISRLGGNDIPKNRNLDELGFFSKAEESLQNMQQQKGTGRQFLKMLENKFQVKQKELAQLGLNKFDNDGKVNKQELIDTIRTNYIKIRENKYINPKDKPDPDRVGNSIEFNLRNNETSDNWSQEVDEMIGSYERGMYADDDDFIDTMVNRIIPERLTFPQFNEPGRTSYATYTADRELLRQALMDGEPSYTDTAGNRISISDDVVEWMDEFAEAQYMANPRQEGGDTLGIGYRAEYDNLSNTYNVRDPEGYEIVSGVSSLDEAAVQATNHAYDNRHLLEPVVDDVDIGNAEPINDPSIPSGAAIYSSDRWKIKGGDNYREFVLSNSNYKGDPQAQEISAEIKAAFDNQQNTQALFKQASEEVQIYESIPDSDKEVYWNEGARVKRVLAASNEQEFYDLYKTVKQNSKDAFTKLKNLQIELNAPGKLRPMTDTAMGFDYDGLPVRSQNPLMRGPRTHYGNVENDMGHMRITDRMMDDPEAPTGQRDKKGMFVEELQSDWSQRGRYNFPTEANRARGLERKEVETQSVETRDRIMNTMQDVGINVKKFEDVDFPEYKNALRLSVTNDSAFYDRVGEEGMEVMEKIIDDLTLQDVVNEIDLKTGLGSEGKSTDLDVFANTLSDVVTNFTRDLNSSPTYPNVLADFVDQRFAVAFDNALAKKVGDMADKQLLSELDDEVLESNPLLGPGGTAFSGFGIRMYPSGRLNSFVDNVKNDLMDLPATFAENYAKFKDQSGQKFDKARAKYGLVPRGPFVEVTDDIVELQLKSLIRRAVDEGHDFIVIGGPEEQIDRWGEDYRKSFETHYNIVVPKVLDKLMKQFDKQNKKFRMDPQNIGITYAPPQVQPFGGVPPAPPRNISGPTSKDQNFLTIRITPEMRRTVKQGMSLFELGTLAAGGGAAVLGSQMTQQENTEPGI